MARPPRAARLIPVNFLDSIGERSREGRIEAISGGMFSGKSEELVRRLRRAAIARQVVQVFKPAADLRHGPERLVTRDKRELEALSVTCSCDLRQKLAPGVEVVGIDEAQFFDLELPAVCCTLADQGKRVLVAGLDQDYLGKPFEPIPQLLAIAEYITKTLAICMVCGAPANHTQRLVASSERVLVGTQGTYEARCRRCFDPRLGC